MMTNKRAFVTGLAIAGAAAGVAVALALPGSASAGVPATGTFTVRVHQGAEAHLDLGRSGMSAGDQDLFTGSLTRNGKRVGSMAGSCQAVRFGARSAVQLCEFDLRFGSSQIATRGTVVAGRNGPGTFTLPITGGTGKYLAATGQVTATASNDATLPITVQLAG
jgi:hypothetical protein